MEKPKKGFNKRAFVSTGMFATMLILPISGLMNHQLQSEPLTVARHFWMSVHNLTAVLFTAFTVLHLTFNWRTLLHSVKKASTKRPSRESLVAVVVVAVSVGMFALHALHTS